jgi:hypothetical protein
VDSNFCIKEILAAADKYKLLTLPKCLIRETSVCGGGFGKISSQNVVTDDVSTVQYL